MLSLAYINLGALGLVSKRSRCLRMREPKTRSVLEHFDEKYAKLKKLNWEILKRRKNNEITCREQVPLVVPTLMPRARTSVYRPSRESVGRHTYIRKIRNKHMYIERRCEKGPWAQRPLYPVPNPPEGFRGACIHASESSLSRSISSYLEKLLDKVLILAWHSVDPRSMDRRPRAPTLRKHECKSKEFSHKFLQNCPWEFLRKGPA